MEKENEELFNIKKVYEFFNNEDIKSLGEYLYKHHISINEVEWELNQYYCLNTMDLKNFLLLGADTALGIAYEKFNENLKH